jgi:cytosine/adenosine deaminase-related metal-dependent hydrolase
MILRARTILPVSRPPVENGAVLVSGNRIRAVGPWSDLQSESGEQVFDLGEVILLPGLVNAHCHLDYTDMGGELPAPRTFTDWIPLITAAKTAWSYSNYAHSWLRGAHMLLRHGTTTVADIEAMPDLLPEVWDATPLRVFSFLEMTGIRARRNQRKFCRRRWTRLSRFPMRGVRLRFRPTPPTPRCRSCSAAAPGSRANAAGWYARTWPNPRRNLKCSRTPAEPCTTGSSAITGTTPIAGWLARRTPGPQ